jgi:MtN3 and saliva related transmembrane protein
MYGLFTVGIALWAVYGFCVRDGPMIVANLVTLVPAGIVLERKLQAVRANRR